MAGVGKVLLVKKAIREIAERDGHPKDFRRVDTRVIFNFMMDNNLGLKWISKNTIKSIRGKLPPHYQEKTEK